MLLEYFTVGTEKTKTGRMVGLEIETHFVMKMNNRQPLWYEEEIKQLLKRDWDRPAFCLQQGELGRQMIELAIAPQPSFALAYEAALESLDWLYRVASLYEMVPVFAPGIQVDEAPQERLLRTADERDLIWVKLDGKLALEELCRCASVQFTIDVNPTEAIGIINRLWDIKLHLQDYEPNDRRWQRYISKSTANYRADRYGGPAGFDSLAEYCAELNRHEVVMHQGGPVRLQAEQTPNLDVDLFLRSVWWHYRLRRKNESLLLEIRPFARRDDWNILRNWTAVERALGI